MKKIDISFTPEMMVLLKSHVGKRLIKIRHDPFIFTNWVFESAGVFTEGGVIRIWDELYENDYFGSMEEVCVLGISDVKPEDIQSGLLNIKQIDVPIGEEIQQIQVVQEIHKVFANNLQTYEVKLTRGIIFVLSDGREVAFEKTNQFSQEILISRGKNLLGEFASIEKTCDRWGDSPNITETAERYVEVLTSCG